MNQIQFHQKLVLWSQAKDLNEFTNIVLENYSGSKGLTYKSMADQVNLKMQQVVDQNIENFYSLNRPFIRKIQHILPPQSYIRPGLHKHIMGLRKIIKSMLQFSKKESYLTLLPPELNILSVEHCSLLDCFKLSEEEMTDSPQQLINKIATADFNEVSEFMDEIRLRRRTFPDFFKKIVCKFFKYASPATQRFFFQCLKVNESLLLDAILDILPKNMHSLHIINCSCLQDRHLLKIAKKFTSLTTLNLAHFTSSTFHNMDIIKSMTQLQSLCLHNFYPHWLITFVNNIESLKNLQSLDLGKNDLSLDEKFKIQQLSNLKSLNISGNLASSSLINSILKVKLDTLNLKNCHLQKNDIVAVINSSAIRNLNLSQNLNMDNAVAHAITQEASVLQCLHVRDCPFLTDEGAKNIIFQLKKLISLDFIWTNPQIQKEMEHIMHERQKKFSQTSSTPSKMLFSPDI